VWPLQDDGSVLDRTAQQRATTLQVGKVNTDEQQELAGRFKYPQHPYLDPVSRRSEWRASQVLSTRPL